MKRVVSLDEMVAADISPDFVYQEYVRLLEAEIKQRFSDAKSLIEVKCPGCGRKKNNDIYEKLGLRFKCCAGCGSIYVSPRPTEKDLKKLYAESPACRYWRKETLNYSDSYMQHIHSPRIHWLLDLIDEFLTDADILVDYQSKYPFFLKKIDEEATFKSLITCQPLLFEQMVLIF